MGGIGRYAGKGFALDCLSSGLDMSAAKSKDDDTTGLPVGVTWFVFKAGQIVCDAATDETWGAILAAVLVLLHVALLVLPLVFVVLFLTQREAASEKPPARRLGQILAAMGVFSVASLGEITQHIHDNWLYVGLFPTYNLAVFYGALSFGQTLLGWGVVGALDRGVALGLALSSLATAALVWGTVATADAQHPWTVSVFGGRVAIGPQQIVWPVTFGCLGVATVVFVRKCVASDAWTAPPHVNHRRYTVAVALSYVVGIASAAIMASSGNQWWHVPTASGFLAGFLSEALWLSAIQSRRAVLPTKAEHAH